MQRLVRPLVVVLLLTIVLSCAGLRAGLGDTGGERQDGVTETSPTPAAQVANQAGPESTPSSELVIRPIARGTQSAIRVPVATTITSQEVLEEVWATLHANKLNAPSLPIIDFETEIAIVLILGERPTAGYAVAAVSAVHTGRSVEITVRVDTPDPGTAAATVLTSAFELAAIPRTDLPIMFVGDDLQAGFDE